MPAIDTLDPRARRTLVELLACVAGADGDVSAEERASLRGAQIALGLEPVEWPTVPSLDEIALGTLEPRARLLAYAAAAWMTLADAIQTRHETELLASLRARLDVPAPTAAFLERHARWIRTEDEDRPPHRELDRLLTETARRLALVEARQAAAAA